MKYRANQNTPLGKILLHVNVTDSKENFVTHLNLTNAKTMSTMVTSRFSNPLQEFFLCCHLESAQLDSFSFSFILHFVNSVACVHLIFFWHYEETTLTIATVNSYCLCVIALWNCWQQIFPFTQRNQNNTKGRARVKHFNFCFFPDIKWSVNNSSVKSCGRLCLKRWDFTTW